MVGRADDGDIALLAVRLEALDELHDGLLPVGRDMLPRVVPDEWCLDPVGTVHPLVVVAPIVAGPEGVDIWVCTWLEPLHEVVPRIDRDIAALCTAGADRVGVVEVPDPCLVEEVPGEECSYGADIDDIASPVRIIEPLIEEGIDDRAVPALYDTECLTPLDLAHEADATGAHDTAASLVEDIATEVIAPEDSLLL